MSLKKIKACLRWTLYLQSVLLFIIITVCQSCEPYLRYDGALCYPCPAGYYKAKDCVLHGQLALCQPCPTGTFQTHDCSIAAYCLPCSTHCKHHFQQISKNCSRSADLQCECEDNFWWQNSSGENGHCLRHKSCPEGQGVTTEGTKFHDTKCQPCVTGSTFSDVISSTQPCTKCTLCSTLGLVERAPCTDKSDAVCEHPHSVASTTPLATTHSETKKDSAENTLVKVVIIAIVCSVILSLTLTCLAVVCVRRRRRGLPILIGWSWLKNKCRRQPRKRLRTDSINANEIKWKRLFREIVDNLDPTQFRHFLCLLLAREECSFTGDSDVLFKRHKLGNTGDIATAEYECLVEWKSYCHKNVRMNIIQNALREMNLLDTNFADILSKYEREPGI